MISEKPYPAFEDAIAQFRSFLRQQGWPGSLAWVGRSAVVLWKDRLVVAPGLLSAERRAQCAYQLGCRKKLGVLLAGMSFDSELSYCYVWSPNSEVEAQHRLMPDGLKMSVASSPAPVIRSSGLRFRWAQFWGRSAEVLFT